MIWVRPFGRFLFVVLFFPQAVVGQNLFMDCKCETDPYEHKYTAPDTLFILKNGEVIAYCGAHALLDTSLVISKFSLSVCGPHAPFQPRQFFESVDHKEYRLWVSDSTVTIDPLPDPIDDTGPVTDRSPDRRTMFTISDRADGSGVDISQMWMEIVPQEKP